MTFDCVYYDEKVRAREGLEIVSADESGLSWEYNTLLVVTHTPSGRVFIAEDSGCSCPTPFECYKWDGPDDNTLDEVTATNLDDVLRMIASFPAPQDERHACEAAARKVAR